MSLATMLASITDAFFSAFRNYEVDGVPSSGEHKPQKADARSLSTVITAALQWLNDAFFDLILGLSDVYDTKAHMDADLVPAANTIVRVLTGAEAGNYYKKSGGTGTGSWVLYGADPAIAASADAVAAADAAAAALDEIGAFMALPRVVAVGDSTILRGHTPLDPTFSSMGAGELVWAHAEYAYFEFEAWLDAAALEDVNGCNQGRSGLQANQLLLTAAKALQADVFFMAAGINDIANGFTGAQTAAHIITAAETLRMTGAPVIVANVRANSASANAFQPAIIACNAALQAWWDTHPAGIIPCDLYSVYCTTPIVSDGAITSGSPNLACATSTPFVAGHAGKAIIVRGAGAAGADLATTILTYTNAGNVVLAANAGTTVSGAQVHVAYSPKTGYLVDGTHQGGKGAANAAPTIIACLKQAGVQPLTDIRPRGVNKVSHPDFDGSGGTAGTGTSGTMGTHWYCQRTGSANTIVAAKGSGDVQEITVTGGSGAGGDGFFVNRNFGATAIGLTDGLWYQWSLEISFDAWAGWQGVRVACDLGAALDTTGDATTDDMPTGAQTLTIVSPPVLADATDDTDFLVQVYFNGATAGSGKVTFREARLCEVPNPVTRHGL